MTQSAVTIQITSASVPSTPSWLGEVAVFAQVMAHLGLLKAIQDQVRFARARFGTYDTIDFVIVLLGYALSGERTLKAFYERLVPFADPFMALFGRKDLPNRSTLSRFLAALDQASVEALRTLFLADLAARTPFPSPGGMSDRRGNRWWIMDIDATKQVSRQRALPHKGSLPAPHRRLSQVSAPGYTGRKRGEVVRTRTTALQPFTHQWIGTYAGAGNGKYREELKRALQAVTWYALAHALPLSQIVIRLDGLYGDAAPLSEVLRTGLDVIARSKEYTLLDRAEVQAALARPPVEICTHPESGAVRALYDCPDIPLREPGGPRVRLIVATHPETPVPHKIGKKRDGVIYELFVTRLPAPAFSAKDVLDLYLHRGSFETVLADEDVEQDTDRWCSHTPCGQEWWQILNQWIWNLRLELGHHLSPTAMRLMEFSPAQAVEPTQAVEPAQVAEPTQAVEPTQVVEPILYGPPQWACPSWTSGFAGSDFVLQADGTLRCPAHHPLTVQERRPERNGSVRIVYGARLCHCRPCPLRAQCQEATTTRKPRQVSAVLWPISSNQVLTPAPAPLIVPLIVPPEPPACLPVLWGDWPRCHIRRHWLGVVRSQTVVVVMEAAPTEQPMAVTDEQVMTRAQRAHWRLSWLERFARNARPSTAPSLTITLHGLPASFAHLYAFDLRAAA